MDKELYIMLTLVDNKVSVPQQVQVSNRSWSFSDGTHLIFEPNSNNIATLMFHFNDFIEFDLLKFVNILKQTVFSRFQYRYNKIILSLHVVFSEDEITSDISAMISNIDEFFENLHDPVLKYIKNEKVQEFEMPKAFSLNSTKPKKKEKKLKFDKEKEVKRITSSVWENIENKMKKKLFGQFGYLATSDKNLISHDTRVIYEFIDNFINDDSKFAEKFKKELLNRWVNTFVRLVK